MTIPLDPRFIPAFSIEDVLLDKDTGAPLSGGLVYFEYDNQRGLLKPIYQISGNSPDYTFTQLPNPMTLSSIGTFEDALSNPVIPYFFPYDANGNVELYYIRVTDADDVPQFAREAQPYIALQGSDSVVDIIQNEISNPQFAEVLFDTSTGSAVISVNAVTDEVIPIAPDWDLVVSAAGAGTITLSQLKPAGTLNLITNPGTLLTITSAGLSKLHLRQRLYGSPNLWGSGNLSASFVAKTYSGTLVTLKLYYSQSNGTVINQELVSADLPSSGAYAAYSGHKLIPASDSSQDFPDAYIDIFFDLPLSIQVDITSVMISSTGDTIIEHVVYDQETLNRQIDHLFHYYQPLLNFKPIPSLLTGWDFSLNPAQLGATQTITTTAAYKWDQTICKSVVGNVAVIRNTVTGGFQATTANAAEAFCTIQYLSGSQARKILGTPLSVNVNAFRTQAGGICNVKVYLYSGSSAAVIPTLSNLIGSFNAAGTFTKNNTAGQGLNWTLIPRGNLGEASGSLSTVSTADYTTLNDVEDLAFSGWEMDSSALIADTDKFAIVVTYSCPTTGTVVTVDSIGLIPGEIPTRPAPQTFNQVLEECQYYYETSYVAGTPAGTAVASNFIEEQGADWAGGTAAGYATSFGLEFNTYKRVAPTVVLYSPDTLNAANQVTMNVYTGGTVAGSLAIATTNWTISVGRRAVDAIANNANDLVTGATGVPTRPFSNIFYHFSADARLGIV